MGCFRPATPGTILALAAFALMLVVTLSTPILKSLYLFQVEVEGQTLQFGVFGFCLSLTHTCVGPKLGYSIEDGDTLIQVAGAKLQIPDVILKGLTYSLIVNPIAAGLALILAITGIFAHFGSLGACCLSTTISALALIFALLAIGLDLGVYFATKSKLSSALSSGTVGTLNLTNSVNLGTALWLTVAAAACLVVSIISFSCSRAFGRRQRATNNKNALDPEMSGSAFYQNRAREEALRAQAERENGSNLPKFAEYQVDAVRPYDASKPSTEELELAQESQGSLLQHDAYDYHDQYNGYRPSSGPYDNPYQAYSPQGYYAPAGTDSPRRGRGGYEAEPEYYDAYDQYYHNDGYSTGEPYEGAHGSAMHAPVASVPFGRSAYHAAGRYEGAPHQQMYDRSGTPRSQRY